MFDSLRKGANLAKFKADQMLREQRVQSEIGSINQQMNALKDRLAAAVLEMHKNGPFGMPELDDLCTQADAQQWSLIRQGIEQLCEAACLLRAARPGRPLDHGPSGAPACHHGAMTAEARLATAQRRRSVKTARWGTKWAIRNKTSSKSTHFQGMKMKKDQA